MRAAVVLLISLATPAAAEERSAVLHGEVLRQDEVEPVVLLSIPREGGAAIGDLFWVFGAAGVRVYGEVFLTDNQHCAGRLLSAEGAVSTGAPAALLAHAALQELCEGLPEGVTLRGRISRTPPGRHTAWLDIGRRSGLRPDDTILVRRNGIPIARGRLPVVEERFSLTALSPLTVNARPEAGDVAELWPSPSDRRWGSLESAVLDAIHDGADTIIKIVGAAEEGLAEGRQVNLYRGGRYVGAATVFHVSDLLSSARVMGAACATRPLLGDRAVVRAPASAPDAPLTAAIFKIERVAGQLHVLIAAGELDGVKIGETFVVYHADADDLHRRVPVAELVVESVKVDFSRAKARPLPGAQRDVSRWDLAERGRPSRRPIGIVTAVHAELDVAAADIDPHADCEPGDIVRYVPGPPHQPGAAVILQKERSRVILHVPPGWGRLADLDHAALELPAVRSVPAD